MRRQRNSWGKGTTLAVALLVCFFGLALLDANAAGAAAAKGEFHWSKFLAPFHSVVLHFPIGFITLAFILELIALRRPGQELRRIIGLVIALGAVSAVVSASLGWLRASDGGYDEHTLTLHKWFGVAVTLLTVMTVIVHRRARLLAAQPALWTYRGLMAGCMVTLVVAGHQGGNLTHGSNYLVKDAPVIVKELLGDMDPPEPAATGEMDEHQREFAEKIQPIFEGKCFKCHGPEKQKGKYRLDVEEVALKGGKSGTPAIKPGLPMESNMVRLITLPADHDDVMPPQGKGQLTAEEILAIIHWIENGAAFAETGRMPKPAELAQ